MTMVRNDSIAGVTRVSLPLLSQAFKELEVRNRLFLVLKEPALVLADHTSGDDTEPDISVQSISTIY